MKRILELGGLISGVVLIVFGVAVIALGVQGRGTVTDKLKAEQIVGSPDMSPAAIKDDAAKAGLTGITLPTCDVANVAVTNGARAKCFADYMRIHALEATGGQTYAQMPRFASTDGKGTNDATKAVKNASGGPADNPVRNVWITETALATALDVSFMASQLALFSIVVGVALLLVGVGFIILDNVALHRKA